MAFRLMTVLIALLAIGGCVSSPPSPVENPSVMRGAKTIFVVRHLHKDAGEDPPLTREGAAAALRLADMLGESGISAIYATPTRRAMQTGEPLAERLGLAVTPYDPRDPAALKAAVAKKNGSVLVVGHSNTVPGLVALFGGEPVPELTEDDYGTVFAVERDGTVRTTSLE